MHHNARINKALDKIKTQLVDSRANQLRIFGLAMMTAYANQYPEEQFDVVDIEKPFYGDIINPCTGKPSRAVMFAGKCDGIIRKSDGSLWLLEHKTASRVDSNYMDRIWEDPQIFTYTDYLRTFYELPIVGILYNVLIKPNKNMKQREGESEDEFAIRHAVAASKTKTGKSACKRQIAESDQEYFERILETCNKPEMFWRQEILINEKQIDESRLEIWNTVQRYLQARRSGYWLRNRSMCKGFASMCEYWPVCSAKPEDEEAMIETYLIQKQSHEELSDYLETISEDVRNGRTIFSHSRRQMFLSCEKKHWFRYERNLVTPEKDDNLQLGSAVHAALESWYLGTMDTNDEGWNVTLNESIDYHSPF